MFLSNEIDIFREVLPNITGFFQEKIVPDNICFVLRHELILYLNGLR